MGKAKFTKLLSLILALTFLVGGGTVATFAASDSQESSTSSETQDALAEIKELLNAISYGEYSAKYSGEDYKKATQTITIDAATGFIVSDADAAAGDIRLADKDKDGVAEGLFTSSEGEVSWLVNVPESAKYAIKIEYYPVVGKAAAIERVFKINDKVPFGEARYLTLSKNWSSEYQLGLYQVGSLDGVADVSAITEGDLPADVASALKEFKAEAEAAGLVAGFVVKEEIKQNIFGKNKTEYNVYATVEFPETWTVANTEFIDSHEIRFFRNDIENNELRPTAVQTPEWIEFSLRDTTGYYSGEYEFYLQAGENKLTIQGQNEPMVIKSITLYPAEEVVTYEDYIADLTAKLGSLTAGKDEIKLEAEHMNNMSSKTIYAIEDRTNAVTSPSDTTRVMLNTVGGEKWQGAGQWIEFTFTTTEDKYRDYRHDVDDGCGYGHDNDAVYQPEGDRRKVEKLYKPWAVAPKSNNRKDGANRGQHRVPALPLQERGQERKCTKDNGDIYSRCPFLSFIIKYDSAACVYNAHRTAHHLSKKEKVYHTCKVGKGL